MNAESPPMARTRLTSEPTDLIPSRNELVTFMLVTHTDIYPEQRHPAGMLCLRPWHPFITIECV